MEAHDEKYRGVSNACWYVRKSQKYVRRYGGVRGMSSTAWHGQKGRLIGMGFSKAHALIMARSWVETSIKGEAIFIQKHTFTRGKRLEWELSHFKANTTPRISRKKNLPVKKPSSEVYQRTSKRITSRRRRDKAILYLYEIPPRIIASCGLTRYPSRFYHQQLSSLVVFEVSRMFWTICKRGGRWRGRSVPL